MGEVPTDADAYGRCMDLDYFAVRRFRAEIPILPFSHPLTADRDGWIAQRLRSAASVLEIGVGDRPFSTDLERHGFKGIFRTMDVANVPCDYRSLGDIREQFEGVVMREVVEHLPRELFYQYVEPDPNQTVIASRYFGDNDPKHLGSAMVSLRFHPYLSVAPGGSLWRSSLLWV